MFREFGFHRVLILYGISIPLALFLGYLLATAEGMLNYALVGMVVLAFTIPLFLRWHHDLVIIFWNSAFIVFFFPGAPPLSFMLAGLSLVVIVLERTLTKKEAFISVPVYTMPLLFVLLVVLVTIMATGGIGGRALGSDVWGAKRYLGIFGAIIGYFAISARKIENHKRQLLAALFFLSGITILGSDLIFAAGDKFYFLFRLFPGELAYHQATQSVLTRITGLAWASNAAVSFMLLRYGIRGILDPTRWWRLVTFLVLVGLGLFGGFRSAIILLLLIFASQFYFERLYRTRLMPVILVAVLFFSLIMVGFIDRMPLAFQRTFSFLPLKIDPVAKHDAMSTLDWRLQMWRTVLPDVPKYLWLGKGYSYSGTDYMLTQEAINRGLFTSFEHTLISGNYHNGILTVIIPFGIWGMLGFLWLSAAGFYVLYNNYRYGEKSIKNINTFLLSLYAARLVFYLIFYGQFDLDLPVLVGLVALSIALNNGMKTPRARQDAKPKAVAREPELELVEAR